MQNGETKPAVGCANPHDGVQALIESCKGKTARRSHGTLQVFSRPEILGFGFGK